VFWGKIQRYRGSGGGGRGGGGGGGGGGGSWYCDVNQKLETENKENIK
jgi:hypothetical protein